MNACTVGVGQYPLSLLHVQELVTKVREVGPDVPVEGLQQICSPDGALLGLQIILVDPLPLILLCS